MIRFIATILKNTDKLLISAVLLALSSRLPATDLSTDTRKVLEFADHLYQTGDYLRAAIEYERYLYLSDSESDTILFKIGLCHQFRQRYDYAVQTFARIDRMPGSALKTTARSARLYNLYKLQDWEAILNFDCRNDTDYFFRYLAWLHRDSTAEIFPELTNIADDSLRSVILEIERKRARPKHKSPVISSLLSAVVPGLGKTCIKRPGDALFSFGMTGFAGIVSWQAFKANLLITGIVSSGITLSFYLGTIYGSYIGTVLYNESLKDKLIEQIEKHNPVTANPYWLAWQIK